MILLVEDNANNREIAKALLESFGATVTTANDGQAALRCIGAGDYDLVVMDLQMPVMDGITATRELREQGFLMSIIGLTAIAFAEDRQNCLDAGMKEFIAKPVSRAKIASIFQTFFEPDEPQAEPYLIDLTQLEPVLYELGPDLFSELLGFLIDDGRTLTTKAKAAERGGETGNFDAELHSLKGAASCLGLIEVARDAQKLRNHEQQGFSAIEVFVALLDRSARQANEMIFPKGLAD